MTTIEQLEQVMQTQIEIGESLLGLLARTQKSIVGLQGEALSSLMQEEEALMTPFRNLEVERARLARELAGAPSVGPVDNQEGVTIGELVNALPSDDATRISTCAARLRTVVERVLQLNAQNRLLLQRSLRFVQETLRLVTDDHTRQLVDHRV